MPEAHDAPGFRLKKPPGMTDPGRARGNMRAMRARGRSMNKGYHQFTKTERGTTIAAAGLPAVAWVATACRRDFLRGFAGAVLNGLRAIDAMLSGLTQIGGLVPSHQVSTSCPLRHRRRPEAQYSRLSASGYFANRSAVLVSHNAYLLSISAGAARASVPKGLRRP